MEDAPTCGTGLAEHSPLPAKLAELTAAAAEVLEIHTKALDADDEAARQELEAYRGLARTHRDIAIELDALAKRMLSYRDLPMGTHDEQVMMSAEARAAFERFVTLEQALVDLLQGRLDTDRQMLDAMRGAASGTV